MSLKDDIRRFEAWTDKPVAPHPPRGRTGRITARAQARKQEIERLEATPLTALGRRILVRQALTTRTGDVGARALARELHVDELTILRILKAEDALWYERRECIEVAARLCQLLNVDHSWLFHTIDYGDLGEVSFDLLRSQRWYIRAGKGQCRNTA